MGMDAGPKQYVLDYQSRQQERRAMLITALREIARTHKVALHHVKFLEWVANVEGASGLIRDRDQIAEELWISRATVIRMVSTLVEWGVLSVIEKKYASGVQAPNEYTIDWQGVDRWYQAKLARQGLRPAAAGSHGDTLGDQDETRGYHGDTNGSHGDTRYSSSCSSSFFPPPLPPLARASIGGEEVVVEEVDCATKETPPASAGRRASAWSDARAALRATGLRAVDQAVAQAQSRRVPPAIVVAAAAFFEAHRERWISDDKPPGWECGALMFFLRQWRAGDDVEDWACWPSFSAAWRSRQARERAEAERAAAIVAKRQRAQSLREWHQHLEREYGAELDALTPDQVEQLYQSLPPDIRSTIRASELRRRPLVGHARTCLLEHMDTARSP